MVEYVTAIGILFVGILWFIVKIQESFKGQGESERYLEWVRHMMTILGFAVITVGMSLAQQIAIDNSASSEVQSLLGLVYSASIYVLVFIMAFYLIMLLRMIIKILTDYAAKRESGESE